MSADEEKKVKCVVWDLDHTIWDGVLLEDATVVLINQMVKAIKTLDERGIIQSIASKNDEILASQKIKEFGLEEYMLYPQIGWGNKSDSVKAIADSLNINLNSIAFIDDQPYERDEVKFSHPMVRCYDPSKVEGLLLHADFIPRFITEDSRRRREMYKVDIQRRIEEEGFEGPQEQFLESLDMLLSISEANEEDLQRAEELTLRTSQLNSTGYTYSYDELKWFMLSGRHKLYSIRLQDRFGDYGHIGLALFEVSEAEWTMKLMLLSCRVMSRGIGAVFMSYIQNLLSQTSTRFRAEFVPTEFNRKMYITYKFFGFKEVGNIGDVILMEYGSIDPRPIPAYYNIVTTDKCGKG